MNLSTEELKAVAKVRGIKSYTTMSKDELLRFFTPSKPVKKGKKNKNKFSKTRIEKIRKEFHESNRDINFLN